MEEAVMLALKGGEAPALEARARQGEPSRAAARKGRAAMAGVGMKGRESAGRVGESMAVAEAVAMKVHTAVRERGDSLPRPQMPWPLVHPFPTYEPTPTRAPPITAALTLPVVGAEEGWVRAAPARDRPPMYAKSSRLPLNRPLERIPDSPDIFPVRNKYREAEVPINTPPTKEEVNSEVFKRISMGINSGCGVCFSPFSFVLHSSQSSVIH